MRESSKLVAGILARQDGVIARSQALSSGMSTGQIRQQLQAGSWFLVHPAVYRSSAHQFSTAARVRAVGLWGGPNAVLSGVAAAWWWGLDAKPPATVEIVIPRAENRRSKPGARVVRRDLAERDRDWFRAAPVTALPLTVMIACVQLGPAGPALLDRALQTKVTMSSLRSTYYDNLGIQGSAAAGRLIRAAADRTAAASERLFIRLLKEAGIRGWRVNHYWSRADPYSTIDVAFVGQQVAIEIDGWAWHHSPDRFQRDRTKQRALALAGWTVLRFTWFDLTEHPARVISDVRQALLQRG